MCDTAGRCEAEVRSTTAMHAKIDPQVLEACGLKQVEIVEQAQNDVYNCVIGIVVNTTVRYFNMVVI